MVAEPGVRAREIDERLRNYVCLFVNFRLKQLVHGERKLDGLQLLQGLTVRRSCGRRNRNGRSARRSDNERRRRNGCAPAPATFNTNPRTQCNRRKESARGERLPGRPALRDAIDFEPKQNEECESQEA